MTTKVECKFTLAKETKGALAYHQTAQNGQAIPPTAKPDDSLIGTFYVRKSQIEGKPQALTVTVEY